MTVAPGSRLGSYEITGRLGEGGMGEVFRATDSKLKREVAIKVLPAAFTEDPERLARFEREAQLLAQLQHPNIASIFGLEEANGVRALVLELVEGEDLAERLKRGALPLEEALAVARQIAEALEAAHEKGIVHRDLKPGNVKLTPDGKVKVLDFGLAKAMDPAAGGASAADLARSPTLMNSPTMTAAGTQLGVILGTAAYMAPEQARGAAVDKRADIWAFGVVVYEMLSGEALFAEGSVVDTLSAVMRKEIDLGRLPAAVSPRLRELVRRCLERDPRRRLRDIGEARIALEAIAAGEVAPVGATVAGGRRGFAPALVVALVAVAVAISALLVWRTVRSSSTSDDSSPIVTEFQIEVNDLVAMFLSPDGRRLLWISGKRGGPDRALWVRDLDSRVPRRIVSDPDLGFTFWSADGNELAVVMGEKLWRYPAAGGEGAPICDFPKLEGVPAAFAIAGAWLADDTIFFGAWRGGIYRVPARGGVPELAIPLDPEADIDFHEILVLPDGKSLLLQAHRQRDGESAEATASFRLELYRDGRRSPLESGDALTNAAPAGYALGTLMVALPAEGAQRIWGVPFDAERGRIAGKKFVALRAPVDRFSAAPDGTFAFAPLQPVPGIVARVDRTGAEVGRLGKGRSNLGDPALSPDGSRLAVTLNGDELWVEDLVRGTSTLLVEEDGEIFGTRWSSDGRTLYYSVRGKGNRFRRIHADPGAAPETVLDQVRNASVTPGDAGILFQKASFALETDQGLYWVALGAAGPVGEPKKVLDGIGTFGSLAPDGRILAYGRAVGRRDETFLTTFPDLEQTIQLSSNGGGDPQWSPDGRSVFYRSGSELIQVDVGLDGQGRLNASPERKLFDAAKAGLRLGDWAVAPDGKGFLFVKSLESDDRSEIVVVLGGLQRAIAETR